MKRIYACLIGDWVCLNDDPDCFMGVYKTPPTTWWKENADIHAPLKRKDKDTMYDYDYVNIHYKGADYRINPIFIQVVTK